MFELIQKVSEGVAGRLQHLVTTFLPQILVALILVSLSFVAASILRWLLYRIFKGLAIDRFLRRSGVAFVLDGSGRLRATRVVAESTYWAVLLAGLLTGLGALDTQLTSRMVQEFVLQLPKLAVSAATVIAGAWLSQYLGRAALVWAVNENLPGPCHIGALVRVILMFVAVVAAADHLGFARNVFLAAFIIVGGGMVLTASLAIGIGAGAEWKKLLPGDRHRDPEGTAAAWNEY